MQLRCPVSRDHSLNQQHFSFGLHGLVAAGEDSDGALIIPMIWQRPDTPETSNRGGAPFTT